MAVYTRGSITDVIALQEVAHPESVYPSAITPTAGAFFVEIEMSHGFIEAVSNADAGTFFIQTTKEASDNDGWKTQFKFTVFDGTPASESPSGSEAAGQTQIAVASEAGFLADDEIYFQDATLSESEWHMVDRVTAGNIFLVDGLDNAKVNTDTMFTNAESFNLRLYLDGVVRWRVIYKHEGNTGANVVIRARFQETQSIG